MFKVLLVFDDYSDLLNIETALKKVGLDTFGINNEFTLKEKILSFNPDVVISSGKGTKVSCLSVSRKLKEMTRWGGKSIIILPANVELQPEDLLQMRLDLMLKAPVSSTKVIQTIAKIQGIDETVLLDKLAKSLDSEKQKSTANGSGAAQPKDSKAGLDTFRVSGSADLGLNKGKNQNGGMVSGQGHADIPKVLNGGFDNISKDLDKHRNSMRARVDKYNQLVSGLSLRAESTLSRVETRRVQRELSQEWDEKLLQDMDKLRQEFASAMFMPKVTSS